jgi:hypothetical protein
MPFSYEDKPNRGLRIFLIGGAGLIGVFTMVVAQHLFIMGMSIVPIALVAGGFLIPVKKSFMVLLPSLPPGSPGFSVAGVELQDYCQGVTFRSEVRNFIFLALMVLLPLWLVVAILSRVITLTVDNPIPLYASLIGLLFLIVSANFWLQERKLLQSSLTTLAMLHVTGKSLQYEFFDPAGERHGGIIRISPGFKLASPLVPVFLNAKNPDNCRLGFVFFFHRFLRIETRHIPDFLLKGS